LQLSSSLHHRLNAYALAASAAGVGVLALAQPAEAKIIYTPTHKVIKPNSSYDLDLNNDGIADFVIQNKFRCTSGSCFGNAYASVGRSGDGVGVVVRPGVSHNRELALRKGSLVGENRSFSSGSMARASLNAQGTLSSAGAWANVTNRYLGLKFRLNHESHYGWARMSVRIDTKTAKITATLTGYAYETIPNKKIIAGKIHGDNKATLGRLAQGASAVVSREKK
jgi:hypothetical protein